MRKTPSALLPKISELGRDVLRPLSKVYFPMRLIVLPRSYDAAFYQVLLVRSPFSHYIYFFAKDLVYTSRLQDRLVSPFLMPAAFLSCPCPDEKFLFNQTLKVKSSFQRGLHARFEVPPDHPYFNILPTPAAHPSNSKFQSCSPLPLMYGMRSARMIESREPGLCQPIFNMEMSE